MYIKRLFLKNIGPFKEAELQFAWKATEDKQPVTVITGINGAGKSVIIDAIRAALSGQALERNIVSDISDFKIEIDSCINETDVQLVSQELTNGHIRSADYQRVAKYLQRGYQMGDDIQPWIIDYWSSRTATDSFTIHAITGIPHEEVLKDVMLDRKSNLQLTNFICHVDYLRSSDVPEEKTTGTYLYEQIKRAINLCVDNGQFKYVRRTDLQPIIEQNGREVTLDKLSSGNIFLIEHIVLLLCKMYSVTVLRNAPVTQLPETPGLLLIDEIETHLHPKWQKAILSILREMFSQMQIILTTHSPFIVSSLPGMRIYTCKPQPGCSQVFDETDIYDNLPVDEVLMSDAFNVQPFNERITKLQQDRKKAIEANELGKAQDIARELSRINPEYFAYLDIENKLKELGQ